MVCRSWLEPAYKRPVANFQKFYKIVINTASGKKTYYIYLQLNRLYKKRQDKLKVCHFPNTLYLTIFSSSYVTYVHSVTLYNCTSLPHFIDIRQLGSLESGTVAVFIPRKSPSTQKSGLDSSSSGLFLD